VPATYANIEPATRDLGFMPAIPVATGILKFVAWFKNYYGEGKPG
jgi:UDP-glucuronate 4-epimerase